MRLNLVLFTFTSIVWSQPVSITWYPLPGTTPSRYGQVEDRVPYHIAAGPDGALWFTEFGVGLIGRITLDGRVTEFPIPLYRSALGGITGGPDGAVWFTEDTESGGNPYGNQIGRITTDGVITEYLLPVRGFVIPGPQVIISGPDGAIWFTYPLGRITQEGTILEFESLGGNSMVTGTDGTLWICGGRFIRRVTVSGWVAAEYVLPDSVGLIGSACSAITVGPDSAFWYAKYMAPPNDMTQVSSVIGRITADGVITEHPVGSGSVWSITSGSDGALWFTLSDGDSHAIGRITTDGDYSRYTMTDGSAPGDIVAGPDGALWLTDTKWVPGSPGRIGRIAVASLPPAGQQVLR